MTGADQVNDTAAPRVRVAAINRSTLDPQPIGYRNDQPARVAGPAGDRQRDLESCPCAKSVATAQQLSMVSLIDGLGDGQPNGAAGAAGAAGGAGGVAPLETLEELGGCCGVEPSPVWVTKIRHWLSCREVEMLTPLTQKERRILTLRGRPSGS